MRQRYLLSFVCSICACGGSGVEYGDDLAVGSAGHAPIVAESVEGDAVLAVVNDPAVTFLVLDGEIGLDRRAARNITIHRNGPDGVPGTPDDRFFTSFEELDATPYVGEAALNHILGYAYSNGYVAALLGLQPARMILEVVEAPDPVRARQPPPRDVER